QGRLAGRSAGWPMHLPLAKNMHVNMTDRLPAVFVAIHDHPKPLAAALLRGEALGGEKNMAGQGSVVISQVIKGGDVSFRNDQKMHRRLWVDVMKGDHLVVFVENACRNLTGNDLAEEAFHRRLQIARRAFSVMVLRPTCPTAAGKRPTGESERLDDEIGRASCRERLTTQSVRL